MLPAALAAVAAIAGLAEAGGKAMSAYGAGKEAKRARRQQEAWHDEDILQREEDRKLTRQRMALDADQLNMQRPASALSFLSGLQDFSEKRARSGSYLDTVRTLAGR